MGNGLRLVFAPQRAAGTIVVLAILWAVLTASCGSGGSPPVGTIPDAITPVLPQNNDLAPLAAGEIWLARDPAATRYWVYGGSGDVYDYLESVTQLLDAQGWQVSRWNMDTLLASNESACLAYGNFAADDVFIAYGRKEIVERAEEDLPARADRYSAVILVTESPCP